MTHRDPRIEAADDYATLCLRLMGASAVIGLAVGFFLGAVML